MSANTDFSLRLEKSPIPKSYLALLRDALRELGPSPACLRFNGCARLLYKAAEQTGVKITARSQRDGSYRVWRIPNAEVGNSTGVVGASMPGMKSS